MFYRKHSARLIAYKIKGKRCNRLVVIEDEDIGSLNRNPMVKG